MPLQITQDVVLGSTKTLLPRRRWRSPLDPLARWRNSHPLTYPARPMIKAGDLAPKAYRRLSHSSGDFTLPTPIDPKAFLPLKILTIFMETLSARQCH